MNAEFIWLQHRIPIDKTKLTDRDKIIILTVTILKLKSNGQLVMSGDFIFSILATNIC